MEYQERLSRMVAAGIINREEAEAFRLGMSRMEIRQEQAPERRRLPVGTIAGATALAVLGAIAWALPGTGTGSAPQKVSEALNQAGAVGDAGAAATGLVTLALLGLLPAGAVLALLARTYNILAALDEEAKKAAAITQACLQRRADLVPSLKSVVEQAMRYEEGLQAAVAGERAAEKSASAAALTEALVGPAAAETAALPRLQAVMEAYPSLRAQEGSTLLQQQLAAVESDLLVARNWHAAAVAEYNAAARGVPGSLVAALGGFAAADQAKLS